MTSREFQVAAGRLERQRDQQHLDYERRQTAYDVADDRQHDPTGLDIVIDNGGQWAEILEAHPSDRADGSWVAWTFGGQEWVVDERGKVFDDEGFEVGQVE